MPPQNIFKLKETGDIFTFKGGKPLLLQLGTLGQDVPGQNFGAKLPGIYEKIKTATGIDYNALPTLGVEEAAEKFTGKRNPNRFFAQAQSGSLADFTQAGGEPISQATQPQTPQGAVTQTFTTPSGVQVQAPQLPQIQPTTQQPQPTQQPVQQPGQQPTVQGANQTLQEIQKLLGLAKQQEAADVTAGKKQTFKPGTATPVEPPQASNLPSVGVLGQDLTQTSTKDLLSTYGSEQISFNDILAQIKSSFGFDKSTAEIEKLDNQKLEELAAVSDNPWLSETLRSKKSATITDKYEKKRDALVDRLKLNQDLAGKALDVFHKEREFRKDLLFKQLDLKAKEIDRQKGFELGPGQQRFEFNPQTGQYESVAAVAAKPEELAGTIKEYQQALQLGLIPKGTSFQDFQAGKKPPTAAQETVATYASRIEQSNPILLKLTPQISGMNLLNFEAQIKAPATFQSNEMQQYMQSARNFINAVLRRESGAVISPSEFSEARKQYLPQPGDSSETLKQKEANRTLVFNSFKNAAGPAYQSIDELLKTDTTNLISQVDDDIKKKGSSYANREQLLEALIPFYPELTEQEIATRVYTLIPDKK